MLSKCAIPKTCVFPFQQSYAITLAYLALQNMPPQPLSLLLHIQTPMIDTANTIRIPLLHFYPPSPLLQVTLATISASKIFLLLNFVVISSIPSSPAFSSLPRPFLYGMHCHDFFNTLFFASLVFHMAASFATMIFLCL